MKNQILPERGEGCRCKGKTPKTFMCMCVEHGTSDRELRSLTDRGDCF